jgi:hypothetical protein
MSAARFCEQCAKPLTADEHGDRRCPNGHLRPDVLGALRQLLPVLRDFRADVLQGLDDQGVELRSLREEVEALRDARVAPGPEPDERVDLAEMARRLKMSEDWLRRNAERLGGRQSKKGGRWKFHPPTTLELFGARDGSVTGEVTRPPSKPRPLPSRVELLPVKDRAA